jgi:hypothetical protein
LTVQGQLGLYSETASQNTGKKKKEGKEKEKPDVWLTPVILATQEAEIRRTEVQS